MAETGTRVRAELMVPVSLEDVRGRPRLMLRATDGRTVRVDHLSRAEAASAFRARELRLIIEWEAERADGEVPRG